MSVEILDLPETEIPAVCDLFAAVYGHAIRPIDWHWKYGLGPRLGAVNVVARGENGRLLGHIGASVFPGAALGRRMPLAQICDVMLLREARGGLDRRGIYPRMNEAVKQRLAERFPGVFAYGFPGWRPFVLGERIGCYRRLGVCREAVIDLNGPGTRSPLGWWVRPDGWHADDIEHAWSRAERRAQAPTVIRSAPYLHWRYRDHPANTYRFWRLYRWGRVSGWFVTRRMSSGAEVIVDALFTPGVSPVSACAALRAGLRRLAEPPPALTTWLSLPGAVEGPIVPIEFRVRHWHSEWPAPAFQPGDTDVY